MEYVDNNETGINALQTGGWFAVGSTVYLSTDTAFDADDGIRFADEPAIALYVAVALASVYSTRETVPTLKCSRALILTDFPLLTQECATTWLRLHDRELTECDGLYFNREGDTVLTIAGLDTTLPDEPDALVLALGEVARGDFTGSMVVAAHGPPEAPRWHLSAADATGKHRLTASTGRAMAVRVKAYPTGGTDAYGRFESAPYATRAAVTDKIGPEEFHKRMLALRLASLAFASGRKVDKHITRVPLSDALEGHMGKPWPITDDIASLLHDNPTAAARLRGTVPTAEAIREQIRHHGMNKGGWVDMGAYEFKIEAKARQRTTILLRLMEAARA